VPEFLYANGFHTLMDLIMRVGTKTKATAKRNGTRTRAKILEAATAEFAEKGFEGARVDVIAERSQSNKNMIYIYFDSKDGLFRAVLEKMYETLRNPEIQESLRKESPVKGMKALIEFLFDTFAEHPEFISLLNSENIAKARHVKESSIIASMYPPLVVAMKELLSRGAKEGVFRRGVDAIDLYVSISALSNYHISNRYTLSEVFRTDIYTAQRRKNRRAHVASMVLSYLQDKA
jgi:TetR/AcrR family transcriptional regulator